MCALMRCCKPLLLCGAALLASTAAAHKASDAYLQLNATGDGTQLRVDIALRDLDAALDLDTDGDGRLTWREVRSAWPQIDAYVQPRLRVQGCDAAPPAHALETRADGVYAVLAFALPCRLSAAPLIRYSVLGEIDPTHRGLARISIGGAAATLRVLDPAKPAEWPAPASQAAASAAETRPAAPATTATAAADAPAEALEKAPATASATVPTDAPTETPGVDTSFLREGIRHIITGYDHVLFLLCLLLPAVMRRTPQGWRPVDELKQAVLPVVGIVTAFTVAHSITLTLAALKLAAIPSSIIEPAIAATIALAALDNLKPVFRLPRAAVTFLFGLIHGFGFAGVLAELDLPAATFAWALLQFNLGLELGQLAIVLVAVALLYALRRRAAYPRWVIGGGSVAAMAIGGLWFVERTAQVSLLGF
jgi:hypothetical protein